MTTSVFLKKRKSSLLSFHLDLLSQHLSRAADTGTRPVQGHPWSLNVRHDGIFPRNAKRPPRCRWVCVSIWLDPHYLHMNNNFVVAFVVFWHHIFLLINGDRYTLGTTKTVWFSHTAWLTDQGTPVLDINTKQKSCSHQMLDL